MRREKALTGTKRRSGKGQTERESRCTDAFTERNKFSPSVPFWLGTRASPAANDVSRMPIVSGALRVYARDVMHEEGT